MAKPKLYLNVPYAQKDQAKALGARWDAAQKKWYVPEGVDAAAFAQWEMADQDKADANPKKPIGRNAVSKQGADVQITTIAITSPEDPNFVPYNGEDPPWSLPE